MSAPAAVAPPDEGLAAALLAGLAGIAEQQLPTGEIACYAPGADGRLAYRRSLRAAVAVHEALACLDPGSAWEETCALRGLLPPAALGRLGRGAARVRHRIRAFLAWEEPGDHLWREGGRHGGTPADPALSAAAALALMDDPGRAPGRWPLYARALDRCRGADGRYRLERTGAGDVEALVDAALAASLTVAGEDVGALTATLLREAEEAAAGRGVSLDLASALARCWARAQLPGRPRLAAALEPGLRERLPDAADPAERARVLLALLDLGSTAPEIAPAALDLLAELPRTAARAGAAAGSACCPALGGALVLAAAARSRIFCEEAAPCTALAS